MGKLAEYVFMFLVGFCAGIMPSFGSNEHMGQILIVRTIAGFASIFLFWNMTRK